VALPISTVDTNKPFITAFIMRAPQERSHCKNWC
jgi:hypothetical protein